MLLVCEEGCCEALKVEAGGWCERDHGFSAFCRSAPA